MRAPAGATGAKKKPFVGRTVAPPTTAPKIGGNYSQSAVNRAVAKQNAPAPIRPAVSRPSPAPKAPPVVVPNNQGHYSRPSPPPPVRPGPVSGGGGQSGGRGGSGTGAQHTGGGNTGGPSRSVPRPPAPVHPGPIAQIPTAPPPPSIDQWLGTDTGYLGEQSSLQQQLADFQAQQATARTSGSASFAQQLRDLQAAQTGDESNLQEDFASRGLINSGSYADALTQLQQQYLASQGNLQGQQTAFESGLGSDLTNFQAQQALAIQQAQQEAIARRAAQYGLV